MSHNNIPDIGDALTNLPDGKKTINPQPKDPSKGHFYVSLVKSFLRIGAGVSLIMFGITEPGALLIAAEVLGIVEELV